MTLALAFYGVADLPSLYDSFDLNYFQLAADWLLAQPQVTGAKLGLYGSSTGGPAQHSRQLKKIITVDQVPSTIFSKL